MASDGLTVVNRVYLYAPRARRQFEPAKRAIRVVVAIATNVNEFRAAQLRARYATGERSAKRP
jgi:hypothetical protein